jgi:PKD repeat protein
MKKIVIFLLIQVGITNCGKKPESNITWSPENPKAGEEVQFTNTSIDAKKYSWNLGNAKISSEKNPKNVYDREGSYIIDLTASSGLKSDIKTVTIDVIP